MPSFCFTKDDDCPWFENVSLIIIRPGQPLSSIDQHSIYDYEIYLNLQRQNKFLQLNHAEISHYEKLPRANLTLEDYHRDWLQFFSDDYKIGSNAKLPMKDKQESFGKTHYQLNADAHHENYKLALRICALRCLFQEIGVLPIYKMGENGHKIAKDWMEKVRHNPKKFLEMFICEDYFDDEFRFNFEKNFIVEWWNWLTPATVGHSPRFDTMYYLVILEDLSWPSLQQTSQNGQWKTLDRIGEQILMAPNDFYELQCLSRFHCLSELKRYLQENYQDIKIERWVPSIQIYQDGSITFLPGDYCYPESVSLLPEKPPKMNETQRMPQETLATNLLNRIEHRGFQSRVIVSKPLLQRHLQYRTCKPKL